MKLQDRDKRALAALGVMLVVSLVVFFWPSAETSVGSPDALVSVPEAERRLQKLRILAAAIPAREKALLDVDAQVKDREKGLLSAETAQQNSAHMLQVLRQVAQRQSPPVELGQVELGPVQAFGADYAEATVSFSTTCQIEQVVNFLADLTAQPELIATNEIQIRAGDAKKKTVFFRLTVSGLLPRRLLPEKRGGALF